MTQSFCSLVAPFEVCHQLLFHRIRGLFVEGPAFHRLVDDFEGEKPYDVMVPWDLRKDVQAGLPC